MPRDITDIKVKMPWDKSWNGCFLAICTSGQTDTVLTEVFQPGTSLLHVNLPPLSCHWSPVSLRSRTWGNNTHSRVAALKGHPKASFSEKFGSRTRPIFTEDLPRSTPNEFQRTFCFKFNNISIIWSLLQWGNSHFGFFPCSNQC